jgi:DNA-binding transcriptional ArsR family regulator
MKLKQMLKYDPGLDAIFKGLADPTRRAMLDRLAQSDATLGQLAEPLDMSLPAVHQHLGVLERAGLVSCEKRGRERWCRLEWSVLHEAESWLVDRRELWQTRLDGLDRYLDEGPKRNRRKRR